MAIPFHICIVDDHALFTEGLAAVLRTQPGVAEVISTQNLRQLPYLLHHHLINVVLLDINMPSINGIDLIGELRHSQRGEGLRIIMVSSRTDAPVIRQAFQAGANAYCTKNASADELMTAIFAADQGEQYLSPEIRDALNVLTNISQQALPLPTDREREILQHLYKGLSTPEIAKHLFISEHTVVSHRKNLLQKANAKNTAELLNISIKEGWL